MAIIIDTNCFANVFIRTSANHEQFKPVLDWVVNGKGLFVYGGSKYLNELKKAPKYLPILRFLKDVNKVYKGNTDNIDRIQSEIEANITDTDFDDPHLPAIVIDTKCKLICSEDKRSITFVKDKALYPKGFSSPVYYTSSRNSDLLCDNYIHEDFKPLCKLKIGQLKNVDRILGNK